MVNNKIKVLHILFIILTIWCFYPLYKHSVQSKEYFFTTIFLVFIFIVGNFNISNKSTGSKIYGFIFIIISFLMMVRIDDTLFEVECCQKYGCGYKDFTIIHIYNDGYSMKWYSYIYERYIIKTLKYGALYNSDGFIYYRDVPLTEFQ